MAERMSSMLEGKGGSKSAAAPLVFVTMPMTYIINFV